MSEIEGLPTREKCDPSDPEEKFLWSLIGLDDVRGAPVMVSMEHLRGISKRLHDVGAMLECPNCGHEETPSIRYRAPAVAPVTPFDDQGAWVPVGEPEPEGDALADALEGMKPHVKREVAKRLAAEFPDVFGGMA